MKRLLCVVVVLRPMSSEATMTQPAVVRVINHLAAKHTWLSADHHSTIPRSTCHRDDALSCPRSSEQLRRPRVSLLTSNHSAHTERLTPVNVSSTRLYAAVNTLTRHTALRTAGHTTSELVGSLMSVFSTNIAISEMKGQRWRVILT